MSAAIDWMASGGTDDPKPDSPDPTPAAATNPAIAWMASGGQSPPAQRPTGLLEKYLGFQEGQLSAATGGFGKLAGGLTYLGKLATTGGDTEAAKRASETVGNALTYQPRTVVGKQNAADMGEAASYLGEKEGAVAGESVRDWAAKRGASPEISAAAGAAANTLANVPQFLLGLKGAKGAGAKAGVAATKAPLGTVADAPRPGYFEPANAAPATSNAPAQALSIAPSEPRTMPGAPTAQPQSPLSLAQSQPRVEPYIGLEQPKSGLPGVSAAESRPNPPGWATNVNANAASAAADARESAANLPSAANTPAAAPKFPEHAPVAPEGQTLTAPDVAKRAQILREIGLTDARKSAVNGDAKGTSTDYSTSTLDGPAGDYMKATLDRERTALSSYSQNIVNKTGGPAGDTQTARYARGNTIVQPLDDLRSYFDDQIKQTYADAKQRLGSTPVEPTNFNKILNTKSHFTGHTDTLNLRNGIQDRLEELTTDDAGKKIPLTAASAEKLRQYIGQKWTPNNGLTGKSLKDALDEDVTSAAGQDVYGRARAVRGLRGQVLDDPKGINKIMDSSGPEGINRKVDIEKIPDAVTGLGVDQLSHLVKTLQNVPDAIKPQASEALAAIKTHFAQTIHDIGSKTQGQWNSKGVGDYLRNNSARMAAVFSPDEMKSFGTLNDAGNILKKDQGYKGAFVQEHNLVRSGVANAIRTGSTLAGTTIGSAVNAPGLGALAGQLVGSKLGGSVEAAGHLKAAQARTVKLRDLLNTRDR